MRGNSKSIICLCGGHKVFDSMFVNTMRCIKVIEKLLKNILEESERNNAGYLNEQDFMESILDNIYQFLYKSGQPVHTIAMGILRGNTFDMYYRGRILDKFAEMFGAMSYDTTIAGRACELFKKEGKLYLNLNSKKKIHEEFEIASAALKEQGLDEEATALRKRAETTTDQGVGSFLLIPISFKGEVVGIFTISSINEYDEKKMLGEDIKEKFLPIAQMLSLVLYMEKISHEKAEEMSRLLISSIDAKDEYQATHSLNVRTMIDMFIDELSRDKELRERVEGIGFKLTVGRIERLRLAALLHDMGKVFVPSKILRKSSLNSEEMLMRKMHSYCTYNILTKSKTLHDVADIASMHHARYFIPMSTDKLDEYAKVETSFVGYPFDRVGQNFAPESQIIALADTFNAIVRGRPDFDGLTTAEAVSIIQKDDHKFHSGLKDIFLTIVQRVEQNLEKGAYTPEQTEEYRCCLWLDKHDKKKKKESSKWNKLHDYLGKIKYNNIGIVNVMDHENAKGLLEKNIKIKNKSVHLSNVDDKHVILSIVNIPKEEGFIWMNGIYDTLKSNSFDGKLSIAFISPRGHLTNIQNMYDSLVKGLNDIKNEPVHYFLNPEMYKIE